MRKIPPSWVWIALASGFVLGILFAYAVGAQFLNLFGDLLGLE